VKVLIAAMWVYVFYFTFYLQPFTPTRRSDSLVIGLRNKEEIAQELFNRIMVKSTYAIFNEVADSLRAGSLSVLFARVCWRRSRHFASRREGWGEEPILTP